MVSVSVRYLHICLQSARATQPSPTAAKKGQITPHAAATTRTKPITGLLSALATMSRVPELPSPAVPRVRQRIRTGRKEDLALPTSVTSSQAAACPAAATRRGTR